jgi:hypothetical protein
MVRPVHGVVVDLHALLGEGFLGRAVDIVTGARGSRSFEAHRKPPAHPAGCPWPGAGNPATRPLIASHDGCSADWLLSRIDLTQSGTVRLIDRLERLGYVVRARRGRVLELGLTAAGQA